MNAVVDFCVEPLGKPLVTVTLPSGQVDTFEVHANPGCRQFQAITDVTLKFVPIDGTTSTVVITINGTNDDTNTAPVANPDTATTPEVEAMFTMRP